MRHALSTIGLRYTLQNRNLPGSPDVANRSKQFVVLVHGCYWHRHAGCHRTTTPKRNRAFWLDKFEANIRRDRRAVRALRQLGLRVLIVWECQTLDYAKLTKRLARLLSSPAVE